MHDNDDSDADDPAEECFFQAQFAVELNLPAADDSCLDDASEAIRREYRDSVKWKRLRCRSVKLVSETDSGSVFVLEIGHAVEFDWTWEGAIAFRPLQMQEFVDHPEDCFQNESELIQIDDSILWSGEVLEVDEAAGQIFVVVSNPEHPPRAGSFYIRPFEFLAFLNAVFNEPAFDQVRPLLAERLRAAEGGVHPAADEYCEVGLGWLLEWWAKSWCVLWGPPGTGKTYTTGQQVARILADESERILVVSTTNRATDAAAIAIGRAASECSPTELAAGLLLRVGKGASYQKFAAEQLTDMLQGTETEFLAEIEALGVDLARASGSQAKALIRKQIKELRQQMLDAAERNFLDASVRVVACTAFRATTFLKCDAIKEDIEQGFAPFTTVFIDEAGLISRVAVAALSLLASRRVVLVGDSRQLAPISRISRILPTNQMKWLANSGLSHLESIQTQGTGVHVLQEQRRMHSAVCEVVSAYQYDGFLQTAADVSRRTTQLPKLLEEQSRTLWYVLDEQTDDAAAIRAERGPGNRSWMRTASRDVLDQLFTDPTMREATGLFISPFRAQAKEIGSYLATLQLNSWSASTVHSQQGSEADIVIFDTVNAGSYSWPYDEWKRLVNVALSRAREAVIILSSRAEMDEPYLRPLVRHLTPQVLRKHGRSLTWEQVSAKVQYIPPSGTITGERNSMGYQLAQRKELRPVLSHEQERLCGLQLDGKPRLVRGVAGSGKTIVLAHWLMQTVRRLADRRDVRIWAVFANRSLQTLIGDSIESAWEQACPGRTFPWDRVWLRHIREILDVLLPEARLSTQAFGFDYDAASAAYLDRVSPAEMTPRCDALFVDEAQDLGPSTLKLLAGIVRRTSDNDSNSRSVNIFYDNAQNIYGRGTPTWSELGLDMRGRSTVMKESFRSTRPITEFALNVLYRLQPPENNPDHRELVWRGLIERAEQNGGCWWHVRFNQIDGPKPTFRQYMSLDQEFEAIAAYCRELIAVEGVQPGDICLIYNGRNIKYRLETIVGPALADLGVELSVQTNKPFERNSRMLLASTSHSYKGYDSEVVIIPAADQYVASDVGVLANNLYVAMTRARSVLTIFAQKKSSAEARTLYRVLEDCLDQLHERPEVQHEISAQDDFVELLERIGEEQRKWLMELWQTVEVNQEPILTPGGEVVAEPLFWFRNLTGTYACFGSETPRQRVLQRMEDAGVRLLRPGESIAVD